jgi:hypothetical protein
VRLASAIEQHPGLDGFPLSAAIGHATAPLARSVAAACVTPTLRYTDKVLHACKLLARRPAAFEGPCAGNNACFAERGPSEA